MKVKEKKTCECFLCCLHFSVFPFFRGLNRELDQVLDINMLTFQYQTIFSLSYFNSRGEKVSMSNIEMFDPSFLVVSSYACPFLIGGFLNLSLMAYFYGDDIMIMPSNGFGIIQIVHFPLLFPFKSFSLLSYLNSNGPAGVDI